MILKEFFVQREGKGVLELVGCEDFDSALLFHGRPVSFNWNDSSGSILQYLTRYEDKNWDRELAEIREHVQNYGPTSKYAETIKTILDLFTNGYYLLECFHYESPRWLPTFFTFALDHGQCRKFYPEGGEHTYLLSRSEGSFDSSTIERHADSIRKGERPLIVSAQPLNAEVRYIVDGNHKALAYQQLWKEGVRASPTIMNVVRLDPRDVDLETVLEFVASGTVAFDNYRQEKTRLIQVRSRSSSVQ